MRRLLVPLVLALLWSPAAHAKPLQPQILDVAGDTPIRGGDIVSGRVSSARVNGRPVLRVELRLVEAPPAGVVMHYGLQFIIGCTMYQFGYVWPGTADQGIAQIDERGDMCRLVIDGRRPTTVFMADTLYDAKLTLKGSTLVWETPYVGEIKTGATAFNFFAEASVGWLGGEAATVQSPAGSRAVGAGDAARRVVQKYVVGSDLR